MNDIDKMPSKCQSCPYWEACEYPHICDDMKPKANENGNINAESAENPQDRPTDGDLISRQSAQHKVNTIIDEFETIMKDIRERLVDESVCGLCEYDGSFISDSGSWCNECPGFERDDCFKLKDQYREEWAGVIKNLPSAQPKHGKWIDKSGGIEGAWNYCSVCGEQAIDLYDFCPNCGADMRGEQDE